MVLASKAKENVFILQAPRSRTCLVVSAVVVRASRVKGPDQGRRPRTLSTRPSLPVLRGRRGCRAPRFSRSPYQPPHSARFLDSSQTTPGASDQMKSGHFNLLIFSQNLLPPLLVRVGAAEGRLVAFVTHDADPGDLGKPSF